MFAQEVLKLYDSRWFGQEIETQSPTTPQEQNPDLEIEEESKKPDLSRLPTLHVRSLNDQSSSMFFNSDQDTVSPTSVLISTSPKLQTILSGKVMEKECLRNADKKGCKRPRKKKRSQREKQRISIDWRITDLSSETNVKARLKFWAHSVASAVR